MPTEKSSTEDAKTRAHRRRRARAAVALARAQLRSTTLARIGFGAGALVAATFGVFAVVLRASEGASAPLEGLVEAGAASIATIAAAPTALAAAGDRRAVDRESGIEALAATRGIPTRSLDVVRVAAAMSQIGRSVALPLVGLALLTIVLAGSATVALRRAALALGLLAFSAITGVTLGSISSLCARLGGRRGRGLFVLIVVAPWMIAELAGRGLYSIPGALSAVLSFVAHVGHSGAGT